MKIKFFLPIMLIITFVSLHAQEEGGWDSKFVVGLGYTPGWFVADYSGINSKIENFGTAKFSTSGFYGYGFSGYISLALIKNLRIGGMTMSGSTSNQATRDGFNKEVIYSASLSGFSVEYTLPFIKNFGISLGTIVGKGSNNVEFYQHKGNISWNDTWQEVSNLNNSTQNISRKFSNSYFTLAPIVNIDIPFYRFFAFRIGGGYQFAFSNNWKADNDITISDMPSEVSGGAAFFQAGIFIGFFNY